MWQINCALQDESKNISIGNGFYNSFSIRVVGCKTEEWDKNEWNTITSSNFMNIFKTSYSKTPSNIVHNIRIIILHTKMTLQKQKKTVLEDRNKKGARTKAMS